MVRIRAWGLIALVLLPAEGWAQYRLDRFTTSNGLPQNTVSAIAQTPDGHLWFATFDGLVRYDGVTFTVFDKANTPEIQDNQFVDLVLDEHGTLWGKTVSQKAVRYARRKFSAADPDSVPAATYRPPDAAGLMRRLLEQYREMEDLPSEQPVSFGGRDREGAVWLYMPDRVIRLLNGRFTTYKAADLLQTTFVRAVFCDREGTVWIGTNENGLYRLNKAFLAAYGSRDGLEKHIVYPLLERRDGTIVFGANDTLVQLIGGRLRPRAMAHTVRSLYEDGAGRLWIGSDDSVAIMQGDRIAQEIPLPNGGSVDAILEDGHGAVWIGAGRGLFKWQDGRLIAYTAADGLPDLAVDVLAEDRQGRLWVGTRNGLARAESGRFMAIRKEDGLAGNRIRSIHEDKDGAMWIGTFDSGISRYKNGRWSSFTTATGLFSNGAFQILEDANDNFWISSNRGIYRVSRRQLNEVAEGRAAAVTSVAYGTQDGMLSAECNGGRQPAGVRARDGRLWFPTQDGIVAIDPSAVVYNTAPPVVGIDAVIVDRAEVDFDSGILLTPGQSDLEIRYTAPSSVKAEHTNFRYMLEGLNDRWIEAGTRRAVHYSHLPPGHYTFKLFASNSDGVWSRLPLTVPVDVTPFFYQTTWFLALVGVLTLAIAVAAYQLRVRRLKANEQRLGQLVAERTAELKELTQQLHSTNAMLAELATVDSLTGLANRRRFDVFLSQEWQRAIRARAPLSMLMLDVDEFKHYNDTFGHQQGDECLRQIAEVLRSTVRRVSDLTARFGGEEFAVVLPETPLQGAQVVAESIQKALARLGIPHPGTSTGDVVTISIGVTTVEPGQERSPADLIAACDRALYRAKAAGRNRISAL